MERHNTHILSEISNEEPFNDNERNKTNNTDNSADDSIYSQYIEVTKKNNKKYKFQETINLIKRINYNIDYQLIDSVPIYEIMNTEKKSKEARKKDDNKKNFFFQNYSYEEKDDCPVERIKVKTSNLIVKRDTLSSEKDSK